MRTTKQSANKSPQKPFEDNSFRLALGLPAAEADTTDREHSSVWRDLRETEILLAGLDATVDKLTQEFTVAPGRERKDAIIVELACVLEFRKTVYSIALGNHQ